MAKGFIFDVELGFGGAASARDIFGAELIKAAKINRDIFYITCDYHVKGSQVDKFSEEFPEQYFDIGIAEANGVGIAAGLALGGKMPFVQGFGPFLSLRDVDQIHTDVAYNDLPVRLIGTHGGLTSGGGPTHYTICDYAIMRAIPNMTMIVPADANQCSKIVQASLNYDGPIYIRMARGEEPLAYMDQDYSYEIGKANIAVEGRDFTIIGCGIGVAMGIAASEILKNDGIKVRVIDMHTLKPMDSDAVITAARETGGIVTVEDHNIIGGLGDGVAAILAEEGLGIKFKRLGIPDIFPSLGGAEELYAHYGYDVHGIVDCVKALL